MEEEARAQARFGGECGGGRAARGKAGGGGGVRKEGGVFTPGVQRMQQSSPARSSCSPSAGASACPLADAAGSSWASEAREGLTRGSVSGSGSMKQRAKKFGVEPRTICGRIVGKHATLPRAYPIYTTLATACSGVPP